MLSHLISTWFNIRSAQPSKFIVEFRWIIVFTLNRHQTHKHLASFILSVKKFRKAIFLFSPFGFIFATHFCSSEFESDLPDIQVCHKKQIRHGPKDSPNFCVQTTETKWQKIHFWVKDRKIKGRNVQIGFFDMLKISFNIWKKYSYQTVDFWIGHIIRLLSPDL